MEILAWSQNLTSADGATVVSKEELLARSDVVTIHYKLSERSRGLIRAADLERMQRSALLINTSRGPIVDEDDLLAALRAGTIAGAGLDTYDVEPLPVDHPLRMAPNTVLTPHLGYVSTGTYERFYGDAVEDVHAFLAGAPVRVL
jgi:phosphoglycerate dehydrogenase-like enzyme